MALILVCVGWMLCVCGCNNDENKSIQEQIDELVKVSDKEWQNRFDWGDCKNYSYTTIFWNNLIELKDNADKKAEYDKYYTFYYDMENKQTASTVSIVVKTKGYTVDDLDFKYEKIGESDYYKRREGKDYLISLDKEKNKYVASRTDLVSYGEVFLDLLKTYKLMGSMYEFDNSTKEYKLKSENSDVPFMDKITFSFPKEGGVMINTYYEGIKSTSIYYSNKNNTAVNVPEYEMKEEE